MTTPIFPTSPSTASNTTPTPGPLLSLTPLKPALRASGQGELQVLLRVQAPAPVSETGPQERAVPRTPLSLALVIDRSGSMDGARLQAAKAGVLGMVKRLHADDEVSLVVYDTAVDVLLPLMSAQQAALLLPAVLHGVDAGGSTDLHSGWLAGAQQLAGRTASQRMCRVVLLSDGQANHGLRDVAAICSQVAQLAQAGISTTTVGLGEGFNEHLMTAMAQAGQGSALYGDRAEDLAEPFDAEVGLLSHLAWRDVRLVHGSATWRWTLLNPYTTTRDGAWVLPPIAEGSEAWAVFSVPMDSAVRAQQRSQRGQALHVTVTARDARGQKVECKASLPALPVVGEAQWAELLPDPLVARRSTELRAADLQRRAHAAVEQGNWSKAEQLLADVQALAADEPWVQSMATHLQELLRQRDHLRFGKEAMYSAFSMSCRITDVNEGDTFSIEAESLRPSYMRRKTVQGRGVA